MSEDEIRREKIPDDPRIADEPSHFAPGGGFERTDVEGNRKQATRSGDHKGRFEKAEMKRGRALFQPLEVDPQTANDATYYQAFSAQYEIYKIPVHHTARSVGRVQDLVASGAPRGPAQIDAETASKLKPNDPVSEKHAPRSVAANQFAEQQEETQASFEEYMHARQSLQAALKDFRAAQLLLHQQALEAERTKDSEQKAKIDRAAETLVKITQVAASATGYIGAIEAALTSDEEYQDATAWDEESGKEVQTSSVKKSTPAKKALAIARQHGGKLDLKGIFIWAMGDHAEYQQLTQDIGTLTAQMKEAGLAAQTFQIQAAQHKLDDVKIAITTGQRAFSAKRGLTRDAARNFGQSLGGGQKTILISLMAEAYQELDLFGSRALEEGNEIMPAARGIHGWMERNASRYQMFRGETGDHWKRDFERIGGAVVDVYRSRDVLVEEVPLWQQTATAWRHFLTDIMGTSFKKDDKDETQAPVGTKEGA
jgi:hypothetical protein